VSALDRRRIPPGAAPLRGAAAAKASAIRTLEELGRERRRQEVAPMPEGWYPHEPGDPFYELDWVLRHEHPEILPRHGLQSVGPHCLRAFSKSSHVAIAKITVKEHMMTAIPPNTRKHKAATTLENPS
jgi:hypothetical protein